MFFKIVRLKIFVIFTGKHLYWGLFLIKLQPFKRGTQVLIHMFPVDIAKFLKTAFLRTTPVAASDNPSTV